MRFFLAAGAATGCKQRQQKNAAAAAAAAAESNMEAEFSREAVLGRTTPAQC
jgi:hypothetical protein